MYAWLFFYFSERTTSVGILTGKPCEESTSSATALEAAIISTSVLSGCIFYSLLRIFIFQVRKKKGKLFNKTKYMTNIHVYTCISNC